MADNNPRGDELIGKTEEAAGEAGAGRDLQAANLFDLRRIIGGLFILYGIILVIVGLFDSQAQIDKAAGVHINLWEGIAMLVLGGLFLLWGFARPLGKQLAEAEQEASQESGGRSGSNREGAGRSDDPGS